MEQTKKRPVIALLAFAFGVFGLLLLAHHIVSYENILRPHMDYLIVNKVITNDINGATFLYYFTNQSNIFVDVFLILFAFGLLGNQKLYRFTHNETLRCAVTLNILVTGIIYCAVLLPFASASFPMEKGIWFSNVVNIWAHMVVPFCFTAFWFFPLSNQKLKTVKTALLCLIYPLGYFAFSVVRGAIVHFYPYPFLNSHQLWETLFKDKPYNAVTGVLLLVAVILALSGIFFGLACALCAIHNRRCQKGADAVQATTTPEQNEATQSV